jgi:hypothetical protein
LVSVVVPCCGQLEFTRLCIPSLLRHSRAPFELIFVDVASLDGTTEYIAGVGTAARVPVKVVRIERDVDFAAAYNAGIAQSQGEFIVLLNNDTIVTEGWLEHLVALADFDPQIGMVGAMAEHRGVRSSCVLPALTVPQILAWADASHKRTSKWPHVRSGVIEGSAGETWEGIHHALYEGGRGLPGGSSLARLLAQERGVRNRAALPRLTIKQILRWAEAHGRRTGKWPSVTSGRVRGAPGETWIGVNNALRQGWRGLPGGSSLARLLAQHRGVRKKPPVPTEGAAGNN